MLLSAMEGSHSTLVELSACLHQSRAAGVAPQSLEQALLEESVEHLRSYVDILVFELYKEV